MSNYRRARMPGGTYFFTVNLRDRRDKLLVREIDLLRTVVRSVKQRHPYHIDAWVVLPELMHCLWTLPERVSRNLDEDQLQRVWMRNSHGEFEQELLVSESGVYAVLILYYHPETVASANGSPAR